VVSLSGLGADYCNNTNPVFLHPNGHLWTSHYYRQEFLYPSLRRQQAAGDAMLLAFDGTPGNTLGSKFWSLHSFRGGARSQVSRGGNFGCYRFARQASPRSTNMGAGVVVDQVKTSILFIGRGRFWRNCRLLCTACEEARYSLVGSVKTFIP
jgi:hypothetical protein